MSNQLDMFASATEPNGAWFDPRRVQERQTALKAAEAAGPRAVHKHWYGKDGHFARQCREMFGGNWRAYWPYITARDMYATRQERTLGDRWYLSVPDFDETDEGKRLRRAGHTEAQP